MQLGDLLDDVSLDIATSSIEINNVEIDSRAVEPGTMFFAMPGTASHGAQFANEAVVRGAEVIVSDRPITAVVPVIVVPESQLHALMTHVSALLAGNPETKAKLVGITGTNGKTSTVTIVASLARALDWNAASIGTLTNARTTPAGPELYRSLAAAIAPFEQNAPESIVAMEVSSHALDQHRVDGLRYCVAAFTNLGHDHLDYHHTLEEYFAAKASLFTPEHARRAVIWTDDAYGARLAAQTTLPVTTVSRSDATDVHSSLLGSTFFWRGHLVNSPLIGGYNVDNSLVAMAILGCLGAADDAIAAAMAEITAIPGRFDVLYGNGVTVVVDYAHTPEGLARLLDDVRSLQSGGQILTVFGAGGDRDAAKRPEMGREVSLRSDFTIITSDNPRSEDPDVIIDAVLSGVVSGSQSERVVDRRAAIARALNVARPGDVVVVAGKGHETTQTIRDDVVAFDDRAVVKELLG